MSLLINRDILSQSTTNKQEHVQNLITKNTEHKSVLCFIIFIIYYLYSIDSMSDFTISSSNDNPPTLANLISTYAPKPASVST